jgi:hypothetical protein
MRDEIFNKWEKQPRNIFGGGGNFILRPDRTEEFCISFQPDGNASGISFFFFASETDEGETAICDYRKSYNEAKYYILNGDHREAYEALINKGFNSCLDYYCQNKDLFGSSLTTGELEDQAND